MKLVVSTSGAPNRGQPLENRRSEKNFGPFVDEEGTHTRASFKIKAWKTHMLKKLP